MSVLSDAVLTRLGGSSSKYLVNLTNYDTTSATTVNATVLVAAATDAQQEFSRVSGYEFDEDNAYHIALAISGVLYKLELWKGRDAGIIDSRKKDFYGSLAAFRDTAQFLPSTDSPLLPSTQRDNTLPDFDRNASPFKTRQPQKISEVNENGI